MPYGAVLPTYSRGTPLFNLSVPRIYQSVSVVKVCTTSCTD